MVRIKVKQYHAWVHGNICVALLLVFNLVFVVYFVERTYVHAVLLHVLQLQYYNFRNYRRLDTSTVFAQNLDHQIHNVKELWYRGSTFYEY